MIVTVRRFIKRVTFRANGMKSYSVVVASDARNEWESRIAKGAEVTDFNTYKMPSSEYMPLACVGWFMSLIKDYLYTKRIMNPQEMLTQREQLMWDIDGIVDEFASNNNISEDDMEDLIRVLCDAVCKNFPTNWSYVSTNYHHLN